MVSRLALNLAEWMVALLVLMMAGWKVGLLVAKWVERTAASLVVMSVV